MKTPKQGDSELGTRRRRLGENGMRMLWVGGNKQLHRAQVLRYKRIRVSA